MCALLHFHVFVCAKLEGTRESAYLHQVNFIDAPFREIFKGSSLDCY